VVKYSIHGHCGTQHKRCFAAMNELGRLTYVDDCALRPTSGGLMRPDLPVRRRAGAWELDAFIAHICTSNRSTVSSGDKLINSLRHADYRLVEAVADRSEWLKSIAPCDGLHQGKGKSRCL
jgi:hypothetical protein